MFSMQLIIFFSDGEKCFVRIFTISSAHQTEFVSLVQPLELDEGMVRLLRFS